MVIILVLLLHCFGELQSHITFFCEGGHAEVNRSIRRGCELTHITYNWNPYKEAIYSTVIVLAGQEYVRYAIRLKEEGLIKKLFIGPNIFVRSCEGGGIMGHPAIDACLVPSDWVRIAYEQDNPALIGRIVVWPAGVDESYWYCAHKSEEKKDVIIYWKTESELFIKQVEFCLRFYGWNSIIIRYGHYNQEMYKQALQRAAFAVFVSVSESQGLALAEAWSMNVPTIVWDQRYLAAHGREYTVISSCPYLSDATGARWKSMQEFEDILSNIHILLPHYTPRRWILDYMTDTAAIQNLMKAVG